MGGGKYLTTMDVPMPQYTHLLRTIGIPGILGAREGKIDVELMKLAKLNKIALLYSRAVRNDANDRDLIIRHELLIKTLEQVSSMFNEHSIKYALFKTVKPIPTTPSDVDVLLPEEDFRRAENLLMSSGYSRTTHDAYSSTLEKDMIVDLQQQPSVSNVPYLPSKLLLENTIVRGISGFDVHTLNPEAELLVIASHSFYKEQMFTMNDYYSITLLAEQGDLGKVLKLARQARVLEALQIIVGLCSEITESVFEKKLRISELSQLLKAPQGSPIQNMPLKFPFMLIIKLLIVRASKDREMRKKLVPAMLRIATPGQLLKLLSHATRRTY
jgi:hypothetical protein